MIAPPTIPAGMPIQLSSKSADATPPPIPPPTTAPVAAPISVYFRWFSVIPQPETIETAPSHIRHNASFLLTIFLPSLPLPATTQASGLTRTPHRRNRRETCRYRYFVPCRDSAEIRFRAATVLTVGYRSSPAIGNKLRLYFRPRMLCNIGCIRCKHLPRLLKYALTVSMRRVKPRSGRFGFFP